ncbi:type II toxin-antitoxin system RelE/ParE family toxin [Gracilimonas sp.]|uniref:type II toxin-antitoxin system RelE/ParE family toxin n=1 Tax=Gracilimonas sp. TaxID=1974203 RepID=UPI0028713DEC|nr:type II toxin-antitoxin system RelE/ParE family toxin [Gracilimonas sp.]
MKLRLLKPAENEIDEAFEYYEEQLEGLGYKFIDEVLDGFKRIKANPKSWSPYSKNTRRCLLNVFPFGVIYLVDGDKIVVVAVTNLHRKPMYWKERI